jgi:enoyl-CoA hydratase/carnithine racemase
VAEDRKSDKTDKDSEQELLVEHRDNGVVLLTLNRPKANALSIGLLGLLAQTLRDLCELKPGAVVIWGGPRIFAAGADVTELRAPGASGRISDAFKEVTDGLARLGCATIAAINGYALGGGLELAMGCDLRIASESSKVGQPEILLGIIPGGGGTQRLARLVGPSRAKDLVMTGRQLGATDAMAWGLLDRLAPDGKSLEFALELATSLAAGPPLAIRSAKYAIDQGLDGTLEAGLAIEREAFVDVLETNDAKRGVESFLESGPGKATFEGN